MITISPEKMTVEEKILGMEVLWQDLCSHSAVKSPDWHEQVLSARQAKIDSGEQVPMDWGQAKQEILNKIK